MKPKITYAAPQPNLNDTNKVRTVGYTAERLSLKYVTFSFFHALKHKTCSRTQG